MDTVKVREDYFNRIHDLQYKRRKDKRDLAVLMMLLVLLMEYITNGNKRAMTAYAPFVLDIKNIENAKAVVKAIDEGLDGKGKLKEPIAVFKERNSETLRYLTTIIPQNEPIKKAKRGEDYVKQNIEEMNEKTALTEESNAVSLELNKLMLQKKMKVWNTQRDRKVRRTTFHQAIDRQTVPIDDYFTVADMKAQYPADSDLPQWERLNCRCYLTYL